MHKSDILSMDLQKSNRCIQVDRYIDVHKYIDLRTYI